MFVFLFGLSKYVVLTAIALPSSSALVFTMRPLPFPVNPATKKELWDNFERFKFYCFIHGVKLVDSEFSKGLTVPADSFQDQNEKQC